MKKQYKILKIVGLSIFILFGLANLINGLASISDPKLGKPISIIPGILFSAIGIYGIIQVAKSKK